MAREDELQQNSSVPTFSGTLTSLEKGKSTMAGTPYSDYMSQMIKAGESLKNTKNELVVKETNAWKQLTEQAELLTAITPDATRAETLEINNSINKSIGNFASSAVQNRQILKDNTRAWFEGVGELISDESFAKTAGNELWYSLDGNSKSKYKQMKDIIDNANVDGSLDIFFSDDVQALKKSGQWNTSNEDHKGSYFTDDWYESFTNDAYDKQDKIFNRSFLGTLVFGSSYDRGGFLWDVANTVGKAANFLVWEPFKFMTFDLAKNTETFVSSFFDGDGEIAWGAGVGAALGVVSWIPIVRRASTTVVSKVATEEAMALAMEEFDALAAAEFDAILTPDGKKLINAQPKLGKDIAKIEKNISTLEADLEKIKLGGKPKKKYILKKDGTPYATPDPKKIQKKIEKEISSQMAERDKLIKGFFLGDDRRILKQIVDDGTITDFFNVGEMKNRLNVTGSKVNGKNAWKNIEEHSDYFKSQKTKGIYKDKSKAYKKEKKDLKKKSGVSSTETNVRRKATDKIVAQTPELFEKEVLDTLYSRPDGLIDEIIELPSSKSITPNKAEKVKKVEKVAEDLSDAAKGEAKKKGFFGKTKDFLGKEIKEIYTGTKKRITGGKVTSYADAEKIIRKRGWWNETKRILSFGKRDVFRNPMSGKAWTSGGLLRKSITRVSNRLPAATLNRAITEFVSQLEYWGKTGEYPVGEMWLAFLTGDDLTTEWDFTSSDKPYVKSPETETDEEDGDLESSIDSIVPTFNFKL